MKKILFLITILLIIESAQAQKLFKEKFDNCSPTFIFEKDVININYTKGDSLLICDITREMEKKDFVKLKGSLAAQIIIDTIGSSCLISYDYKFNSFRKPFDIEKSLNSLTGWDGYNVNEFTGIIFKIFFKDKDITFQRFGYSRNSGWRILSDETFKKPRTTRK